MARDVDEPRDVEELGQLVKREFRGEFDQLNDIELGRLWKEKYPEDFGYVRDMADSIEYRAMQQVNAYDPNQGGLTAKYQKWKSKNRTELLEQRSEELAVAQRVVNQVDAIAEAQYKRANQQQRREREAALEGLHHAIQMMYGSNFLNALQAAGQAGIEVETLFEVNKTRATNQVDLEYQRHAGDLKYEQERRLLQERVEAAVGYNLLENRQLKSLIDDTMEAYVKLYNVKNNAKLPAEVREQQEKLLSGHIAYLEAQISGRQERLVQNLHGNQRGRGVPDSDAPRDLRTDNQTGKKRR